MKTVEYKETEDNSSVAMHSSNRQARNKISHRRRKIAMFVEIQDISQNNVIRGAQRHVLYARKEVTWQKLVEVLGKQKNLREKKHLQSRLIPIVS